MDRPIPHEVAPDRAMLQILIESGAKAGAAGFSCVLLLRQLS